MPGRLEHHPEYPSTGVSDEHTGASPAGPPPDPEAEPVFVDGSGRRGRRVRLIAFGAGGLGLMYTALVGVSLAAGASGPAALNPFPVLLAKGPLGGDSGTNQRSGVSVVSPVRTAAGALPVTTRRVPG